MLWCNCNFFFFNVVLTETESWLFSWWVFFFIFWGHSVLGILGKTFRVSGAFWEILQGLVNIFGRRGGLLNRWILKSTICGTFVGFIGIYRLVWLTFNQFVSSFEATLCKQDFSNAISNKNKIIYSRLFSPNNFRNTSGGGGGSQSHPSYW